MSLIRVPGFDTQFWSPVPAYYRYRPQEVAAMSQAVGFGPPMWKTWIEFLAPSFGPSPALAIADIWGMI